MSIVIESVTPEGRIRKARKNSKPPQRLDLERRDLAATHVPLAVYLAKVVTRRQPIELSEAIAVSFSGLVEAAARFDPAKGVTFGGYAAMLCRQRVGDAADRTYRHNAQVDHIGDAAEVELPDTREPEPAEAPGTADAVARLRRHLSAEDFTLLWQVHAEGKPLTQLAAEAGVSKQWIKQKVDRAADRARRLIPELAPRQ